MAGEESDGIPLREPIDEVVWSEERAEHIRTRAGRKGLAEINIEPLRASEAALDPNRLVRRGSGREWVEVLGNSPSAAGAAGVDLHDRASAVWGLARWQRGRGLEVAAAYWEGQGDDQED